MSEWSGICRANKKAWGECYWTISDSPAPAEIVLVNEQGECLRRFGVLSSGGGMMKNHDWEEISTDDAGHLWIIDNMRNAGGKHVAMRCNEPMEPGQMVKLDRWIDFREEQDVEAAFAMGDGFFFIPKRKLPSVWEILIPRTDDTQAVYRLPHEPVEKANDFVVPVLCERLPLTGVATAADYISADMMSDKVQRRVDRLGWQPLGLILVHCYLNTYIVEVALGRPWRTMRLGRRPMWFGQTEGACFTHGGEGVLIQNEAGDYKRVEWV